jgi:PKD repeat protein
LEFFDYTLPEAYTLSNFIADITSAPPNTEVTFTDISIHDPLYEITSWKWDFDNDGVIDSEEQNPPAWTYTEGGTYDVRLITETEGDIDTLIIEDYISINSGYFVYDGDFEGADYSGAYIYDYLIENGYEAYYRDEIPNSLLGFDAAFLSFGNFGSGYTELNDEMADVIQNYIEEGGYVYLEGGDALGFDQDTNTALHNLFGLSAVNDGTNGNAIDSLYGQEAGIMNGMYFSSNTQESNEWIDIYTVASNGVAAFSESNYGVVGVESWTQDAHRTFCFSYALSKLDDGEFPSTKDEFIFRLLNFFDFTSSTQNQIAGNTFDCIAYPNPMSGQTTIEYTLLKDSRVILEVTDARGQLISQYLNENQPQGTQRFEWNAEDLPAGMYFYTIQVDNERYTGKIIRMD